MRISVDLNRCQGYAQCCFADPTVFKMHGEEALEFDPAPSDERRLHVIRAAKACPVQAIYIGESYEDQEERSAAHE
ncbi:ferredoxin [Dictyobacter kobayashii]|uniref:Ferredoxin n=1 Tax=Dictyobacter kobayashii TaxID=2014872 RepID=A0A402AZC6_9CHLR|nr:ferredoxin [Dictyobacter kobayashii]GCE24466.1 ferredoxin [Dictyobacter kobayashii]